ncbi:MAG: hypothetical protein J5J06_18770 [Phycisphaerae bacterium]|nr:hypothetical protein [Phycisphaerae bacterium]
MSLPQASWAVLLFLGVQTSLAGDVTIEIKPNKSVYYLGEPVFVTATVTNSSSAPIKLIYHNAPTVDQRMISVADLRFGTDPQKLEHWSGLRRVIYEVGPATFVSGQSATLELVMLYTSEGAFYTEEPGTYWIQGRAVQQVDRLNPYIEYLTEPIAIQVQAPPERDRETWEWLKAHKDEYGRLIQTPWDAELSPEFLAHCDRLSARSTSVYTHWLAEYLGRWWGPHGNAWKGRKFREIAKATAGLEKDRSEESEPPKP